MSGLQLEDIDFEWVEKCDQLHKLKKAEQLLKNEPFVELLRAVRTKIRELEPAPAAASDKEKNEALADLAAWSDSITDKDEQIRKLAPKVAHLPSRANMPPVRGFDPQDETVKIHSDDASADIQPSDVAAIKDAEKRSAALREKDKGNEFFRTQEFDRALRAYTAAIQLDPKLLAAYTNRAACYLKMKLIEKAEEDCTAALRLDANNVKALLRRGVSRHEQYRYSEALQDLEAASAIEPHNKEIIAQLAKTREAAHNSGANGGKPTAPSHTGPGPAAITSHVVAPPMHNARKDQYKRIVIEEVEDDEEEEEKPVEKKATEPAAPAQKPAAAASPTKNAPPPQNESKLQDSKQPEETDTKRTKRVATVGSDEVEVVAPKSHVEFLKHWTNYKDDPDTLARYLKVIPPSQYSALFSSPGSLNGPQLESILFTLARHLVKEDADTTAKILDHLKRSNRFNLNLALISKACKTELAWLFEQLQAQHIPESRVASLRADYL